MKIIRPVDVTYAALTASSILENDYDEWDVAVGYATGARVQVATAGRVYESVLVTTNTGNDPTTDDGTNWVDVGAMNRWRMFDNAVSSQSTATGLIDVTVTLGDATDSIAFINMDATSAQITITDPAEGQVFDQTYSFTDPGGVTDWYAYFFDDVGRKADYVVQELPLYMNGSIRVQVDSDGLTKVGALVFGRCKNIGNTQYGAQIGIQDYSIKQQNDWGDYTIVERAFRKTGTFVCVVESYAVDALQTLLATYRARPAVYIGSDAYGSTVLYGFFKSFSIDLAYPTFAMGSIEVEGLT